MRTTPHLALPTLGSAPEWVAMAALKGLRLEVAHTGRRTRLPRAARVAAPMILAAALENAARHADVTLPVVLEMHWRSSGLTVRVLNVPGETGMGALLRPGRGIAAMMARAHRAGGWLRAGLCAEGFEVEAFLPGVGLPSVRPRWLPDAHVGHVLASTGRAHAAAGPIRG